MTSDQFQPEISDIKAFQIAYNRLNYAQFCVVIDNCQDSWTEEKWGQFRTAVLALHNLGILVPHLVEAGKVTA